MRVVPSEHGYYVLYKEDEFGIEYVHAQAGRELMEALVFDDDFGGDSAVRAYLQKCADARNRTAARPKK